MRPAPPDLKHENPAVGGLFDILDQMRLSVR